MKKIILVFLMVLLVGCQKEDKEEIDRISNLVNNQEEIMTPSPVPEKKIAIGIYKDYQLVHEYNTKFKNQTDIAIFNVIFSNEEKIEKNGNFKNTWKKYYDQYEDLNEYKVGFEISLEANGEYKEVLMLDPQNQYALDPFLYPFLYDDIHNSGSYSHVTMKDLKEDTIYSSIKLYLHQKTSEITSPITLKAFVYKDESEISDGHYQGNNSYTITINNK